MAGRPTSRYQGTIATSVALAASRSNSLLGPATCVMPIVATSTTTK